MYSSTISVSANLPSTLIETFADTDIHLVMVIVETQLPTTGTLVFTVTDGNSNSYSTPTLNFASAGSRATITAPVTGNVTISATVTGSGDFFLTLSTR